MKGIYLWFCCRRSCYLYILQDICFDLGKKKFCCCYSYYSVEVLEVLEFRRKSWKSPGTLMQKVVKKVKKGPGKSWNLNQFFWWDHVCGGQNSTEGRMVL